jgi:hypothetical protein
LMSEFKTSVYRIYKNEWNVWNDLRRFFETIKHFYGIQGNFNSDCLKKIFSNFEEQQHKEFYYASNHYSHINSNIEPFEGWWIEENMENILEQFDKLITESAFKWLWEEVKWMW